jgi:hypothetical protein
VTEQRVPHPSRITVALDAAGLFGDDADRTLGVIPPVVDLWEQGALVPTDEQLADLAQRAGVTVEWFYDGPVEPLVMNVCFRTKKAAGGPSRCVREVYPAPPDPPEGVLF